MANVADVRWISDDHFRLAESPLWDERNNRLFWADIPAGNVHALDLDNGRRAHWHFDGPVGSLGSHAAAGWFSQSPEASISSTSSVKSCFIWRRLKPIFR